MTHINRAIYISTGVGCNQTIGKRKEKKKSYLTSRWSLWMFVISFSLTFTFLACVYVLLLGACTVTHTHTHTLSPLDAMTSTRDACHNTMQCKWSCKNATVNKSSYHVCSANPSCPMVRGVTYYSSNFLWKKMWKCQHFCIVAQYM